MSLLSAFSSKYGISTSILNIRRKESIVDGVKFAVRNDFSHIEIIADGFFHVLLIPDEDIEEAARRELKEETGLDVRDVRQFYCFGRPDRDPRGRTISIGFIAICERKEEVRGGDDAKEARWFCVRELPELAFDHNEIVGKAMETISQWRKLGIIKEVGCD